jgi:hypothetical protein
MSLKILTSTILFGIIFLGGAVLAKQQPEPAETTELRSLRYAHSLYFSNFIYTISKMDEINYEAFFAHFTTDLSETDRKSLKDRLAQVRTLAKDVAIRFAMASYVSKQSEEFYRECAKNCRPSSPNDFARKVSASDAEAMKILLRWLADSPQNLKPMEQYHKSNFRYISEVHYLMDSEGLIKNVKWRIDPPGSRREYSYDLMSVPAMMAAKVEKDARKNVEPKAKNMFNP